MDNDIAEFHDLVVLGAGISGLNTAHVLRQQLPHRRFTILEARSVLGGTWSFFQYPGFRSDSYMTVFGLRWHPWPHEHKVAAASDIAAYLRDAADQAGLADGIRFRHRVTRCEWRDADGFWRLAVDADGTPKVFAANFVFACTGYYSYHRALDAVIPGLDAFAGTVAHPQWWPRDLDYAGKRVVVVGSGATAFTLVPALADKAAHVTMLQRSPSYVVAMPTRSGFDKLLLRMLWPRRWAQWLCWWKDLIYEMAMSQFLLRFPAVGRWALVKRARQALPPHIDVSLHFNPRYDPFQQRLCICPDGDFFRAMHQDHSQVVTDTIETVTPDGIQLKSGRKLPADIIVTATGLYFELLNGMRPTVNGETVDPGACYTWRGGMLEALPNMGYVLGYVVQSWTPGADAMAKMLVRVIKRMEERGATKVVPVLQRWPGMPRKLAVDVNSNYFLKAADRIPKVTGHSPWYGRTHWLRDVWALCFASADKGLVYSGPRRDDNKVD